MASKFDGYWQNDGVMNASRLIAITGTGGDHFLVAKIVYRNTLTDALEDDCTFLCTVEMQGSESVLEQRIVRPRETSRHFKRRSGQSVLRKRWHGCGRGLSGSGCCGRSAQSGLAQCNPSE